MCAAKGLAWPEAAIPVLQEVMKTLEKETAELFALENEYDKAVLVMSVIELLLPWVSPEFKKDQWPRMQCLQQMLSTLRSFKELDQSDDVAAKMKQDPLWKLLGQLMRLCDKADSLTANLSWGAEVWARTVKQAKELKGKAKEVVIAERRGSMVSVEKTLHHEVSEPAKKWKKLDMTDWELVLAFGKAVKQMESKELMAKISKLEEVRRP